jgi:hypothetical protein
MISQVLDEAPTAEEVIEMLQEVDPKSKVLFVADYGDRTHTMQALPVAEVLQQSSTDLRETAYSSSEVAWNDPNDCEGFDNDVPDVEQSPVAIIKSY